jgi:hypothetical protein
MEWGVGPGGGVPHRGCCPAGKSPRQAHPGRRVAGAGPLSGEGRTCSARRDAPGICREQWRSLHGLAVAPGQPVVSYVGYSLKEPWGEPRVVIGIDADEAEYLAEFLDRDECAQRGQQVPPQQAQLPQATIQQMPIQQMPIQQVPLQSGPLQSGPFQQVKLTESAPEGTGEYPSSALLGAPVPFGRGRQSADQARDLAGWISGELPGQVNEQLTSWPPSADQPPASV